MRYKVSELEGELLDAAVAKAEGRLVTEADEPQPGYALKKREEWGDHIVRWYARDHDGDGGETDEVGGWEPLSNWGSPSTDWDLAGQLIERERPAFRPGNDEIVADIMNERGTFVGIGPTYLVAFCRAHVTSVLGEEVEL